MLLGCTLLRYPLTLVASLTQAHRRALCGGAPLVALCLWADSRVRLHRRRRLFLPAPPEGEAPVSRLHPAAHQGVSRSRDAVGGRDGPEKTE